MSLKIRLKANEKLIIGGAVVKNGGKAAELYVENNVPILREKDILSEKEVDTPCRRIYFAVQLMYIDEKNLVDYHKRYWDLVKDVLDAAPSTKKIIEEMSEKILCGHYYQALKTARKLLDYEKELLEHGRKSF
ncbi:MAG: flagellar protein [Geobacteraceae bacterium]|nr:MAG: flagellar protein [Geobacteraceae bacterium]